MKKKHRKYIPYKWSYPYRHSLIGGWKQQALFKQVETFLIFIGYPRSGHSLIGSFLDAHPNMVISNQLNALSFFIHNYSKNQIYYLIWENACRHGEIGRSNSSYNYQVPNQWQGKSKNILVIGDKRGGTSTKILADSKHRDLLSDITVKTEVPLKMIHVIRNPFDNISTMVTRALKKSSMEFDEQLFQQKVKLYYNKAETISRLIEERPKQIHNIHLEEYIRSPKVQLREACNFIGLETSSEYLNDCASVTWETQNKSRFKVDFWTQERIDLIYERNAHYPFLQEYRYN
jgi:hypothetical protein